MARPFHFPSMLIGLLYGIALSLIFLRLAGIIDNNVSMFGQLAILPALGIQIALQIRQFRAEATGKVDNEAKPKR